MFNLRNLDLNLLTVFEAIYESGSVSGAANHLALSQSATSHALSRLREACGDDLFVRTRRGLVPTPTANTIYPVIKQALETVRTSLGGITNFDPARSQRHFRITIPHPLGPFYALDLLTAVAAAAPGIAVTFDTVSKPLDLEDHLRDGIVDLAIDWLPIASDLFINQRIFDDELALLARGNHPMLGESVTVDAMLRHKFVLPHRRREIEHLPQALKDFYSLQPPEALRVSELLEIPTIVASTDLLGIFPTSMGPIMEARLRLRILTVPIKLSALPIYTIWHKTRRNDTAHRWLRDLVKKNISRFGTKSRQGSVAT